MRVRLYEGLFVAFELYFNALNLYKAGQTLYVFIDLERLSTHTTRFNWSEPATFMLTQYRSIDR